MENRKATLLFYICNSLNAIGCFFALLSVSQLHPLLPFFLPYLYFSIRLGLYKLWYRAGYHPLPQRRHFHSPKGGMSLPVFTETTEEYRELRQQQSLKYQMIYNIYKVIYRSFYFTFCFITISVVITSLFTEDNRYLDSPLQAFLRDIADGSEGIEKVLFVTLFTLTVYGYIGLYKLGEKIWQKHFYKRYPVTVLVTERDEPILMLNQ